MTKKHEELKQHLVRLLELTQPVHLKMLANMLGLSQRHIKSLIHELRTEHIPIASGNDGYWLTDKEGMRHTINALRMYNKSIVDTIFNCEESVR